MKKQFSYRTTVDVIDRIKSMSQESRVNGNDLLDVGVYLVERELKQGKSIYELQNQMWRKE